MFAAIQFIGSSKVGKRRSSAGRTWVVLFSSSGEGFASGIISPTAFVADVQVIGLSGAI